MKRLYTKQTFTECNSQLVIVPFIERQKNTAYHTIDAQLHQQLSDTATLHQFSGKANEVLTIVTDKNQTVIAAGLGKHPSPNHWRDAIAKTLTMAINKKIRTVCIYLDKLDEAAVARCVEGVTYSAYRFHKYKSNPSPISVTQVKIGVITKATSHATGSTMVKRAAIAADAVCYCRDLVNEPTNKLGVPEFVSLAKKTSNENNMQCKILSANTLRQKGFGLISAVGQGASQPPALVELRYTPPGKTRTAQRNIALIGKGVVFDSGGLCLKPADYMTNMKTDMAGAAVVLSVMKALPKLQISHQVTAFIPLAENAIGENAARPGDVITAYNGQTVEITNTDAEGRLLLADTLSYAGKNKFDETIDFATLTGASSIALGRKRGAIFSPKENLISKWMHSAYETGEFIWPLPLAQELEPELRSDVADLKNSGGRFGGTVSAALFLKKFTSSSSWVHLDIAGPARNIASTFTCPKGGTGFMVLTTLNYLQKM